MYLFYLILLTIIVLFYSSIQLLLQVLINRQFISEKKWSVNYDSSCHDFINHH